MKIVFSNDKDADSTLADNSQGWAILIQSWGLAGIVTKEHIADSAVKRLIPHGNADGPFVFTVQYSHADPDAAAAYLATQLAMVMRQDRLVITTGGQQDKTIAIMAGAVLEAVTQESWVGCKLRLRYQFAISTVKTTDDPA